MSRPLGLPALPEASVGSRKYDCMFLLAWLPKRDRFFQNTVRVGGATIRLRVKVMMIKEAENVCHQGAGTAKTARANHLAGNRSVDQVEPGRGGWRKMQMKAGMALKPGDDLGMFVSGVVVADDVNIKLGRTSRWILRRKASHS